MGEGYRAFCERYGIEVDESRFEQGVASAARFLEGPDDAYDAEVFVAYTRHIIEQMGGRGDRVDACAREIYDEWAACHHFELYEEVPGVLRELRGVRPADRPHFEFAPVPDVVSIALRPQGAGDGRDFRAGTRIHEAESRASSVRRFACVNVEAGEAVMVGDSVTQDVEGALRAGMRGVLLHRSDDPHPRATELVSTGVPVVRSLTRLRDLVIEM